MNSVTAVGGTVRVPETAVSFSGGGFSDVVRDVLLSLRYMRRMLTILQIQFPRPPFQELAVGKFLKTLPPGTFDGLFNRTGRVRSFYFPDTSIRSPLLICIKHVNGKPD